MSLVGSIPIHSRQYLKRQQPQGFVVVFLLDKLNMEVTSSENKKGLQTNC
ncbi:hypothetical protein [Tepidibacillus fermentans]|uniref:Uncharacterized protein n=1 Tax=Tepidibacillus fermentans TaxID=1281767 RepID=A0A4R3KBQ3_9BACI|nr:hypothetical protein [Tepidibacillus fermentans]TCS80393.1 hypothetical protein EDD72_11760 [Tepidibacillus fermentans]